MSQGGAEMTRSEPTWRSGRAWAVLVGATAIALAADLTSKWLAFREIAPSPVVIERARVLREANLARLLPPFEPVTVVPHVLDLTLVLNRGAVFGIGAGMRWFFVLFTLGALGLAVWIFGTWTRPRDHVAHIAMGLLVAGGLGNLYDRLVCACVRDFLHPLPGVMLPFGWRMPLTGQRELWPYVSNIADLWLIIGIGALMLRMWQHRAPSAASTPGPR